METTITPTPGPADALLAGAILEEYRGLLEVPVTLEAAAKKKRDHGVTASRPCLATTRCTKKCTCHCTQNCVETGTRPCTATRTRCPVKGPKKKAQSWNDLPRA